MIRFLSQGHVKSAGNSGMDENGDGLQRALEGELVEFLRNQNVKLMQELESLKGQLQEWDRKSRFRGCFFTVVSCGWNFS